MKRGRVIGVDLGGTNLRAGLIDKNRIIKFIKIRTLSNKNSLLKALEDVIKEVFDINIIGIGIGSPGPLKDGVLMNPPNIPLRNFDLKKFFQKKFNIRCEVENDAKCVALAELNFGCGKGKKNFYILTLGTGIGGGVIIEGKLYNKGDFGGELGNIYLDNGKTFESLASGGEIKRRSLNVFKKELDASDLMKLNDRKARDIIEDITESLARGIGSLINVFNPEIVVLAGGMREAGDKFLDLIRKKAEKYIFLPGKYEIVWSKLEEPGILGASLLL
mgnify:CR=1 FL=1